MTASVRSCCVPYCGKTRADNTVLHAFPDPTRDTDRFLLWVNAVGSSISALDHDFIFKNRKICHSHFEEKFLTWTTRLAHGAIPTLHIPESSPTQQSFCEEDTQQEDLSSSFEVPIKKESLRTQQSFCEDYTQQEDLSTSSFEILIQKESLPTQQSLCEEDTQQEYLSSPSEVPIKKESLRTQQSFYEEDTQQEDLSTSSEIPVQKDNFYISRDPVITEIIKGYEEKEKECKKLKTQLKIMRKRELRYISRISALETALKLGLAKKKFR